MSTHKIGILGHGVVGSAVAHGLQRIGNSVFVHDPKLNTSVEDVLDTEIIFICVPTPSSENGACDITIVESVIEELCRENYDGVICIKSTVPPGTTGDFRNQFSSDKICFVPEFLRERCAISDFVDNHNLCVIGCESIEHFDLIKSCHGNLPAKFVHLTTEEAEFSKYFSNCYNATLITFANAFYAACKSIGVNYSSIKQAIVNLDHISDSYLDCNENFRGFGGACLPKDTKAMDYFCKSRNLDVELFKAILEENEKYKTTVFPGMRED